MLAAAEYPGACQTVRKPFSKAELPAAVEVALGTASPQPSASSRDVPVTGSVQERRVRPAALSARKRSFNTPPGPDTGIHK